MRFRRFHGVVCLAISLSELLGVVRIAGAQQNEQIIVDTGHLANSFSPLRALGGAIDRQRGGTTREAIENHTTWVLTDPVLRRRNFFGAHVSRAARIEPVTPEGCVYVTETFAAVLALYNADEFACDYVGMTEAAKHYGTMRMFLLRRSARPD